MPIGRGASMVWLAVSMLLVACAAPQTPAGSQPASLEAPSGPVRPKSQP